MNPVIEAVRQKYPGAYDDLSDDDLTRAIAAKTEGAYMDVPGFKSDFDRLTAPKLTPSLPEPGQQQMSGQPVPEGPTQAFPTGAQDAAARAKIPPMSLAEAGNLAMTPFASLPRVGKPGGVARGVSEIVDSAIEQTLLTPASGPLGVAFQVPGLRQALTATIAASLTKAAAQKAGEASVTKSPQTITEAVGLGLMGAAGARDLLPRAAAEAAKPLPESEVKSDASRHQETGEIHAPVPVQPGESARTVPVEEGREGVQSSEVVPKEVALESKPPPAPTEAAPPSAAPATAAVSEAKPPGVAAPEAPSAIREPTTQPKTLQPVASVESVPATENGGRIAIILPNGKAVVGGRIHADTWNRALEAGVATDKEMQDGFAGFVKPDGTAWGVNGKPLPNVSEVFLVGVEKPKPPARPDQRPPQPRAGTEAQKQAQPGTETPAAQVERPGATPEVRKLALEEQRKAGWDTKWPFIPADLQNPSIREAIRLDPTLSDAEKTKIFAAGEKLGVVPKDEVSPPAAAKVQTEVSRVARTEGTRPAKEIKNELVDRLERAIDVAPSESEVKATSYTTADMKTHTTPDKAEMVTIEIPGDGTFKIRNTKEALSEILKRAKKIATTSKESKAQVPKGAVQSSERALGKMEEAKAEEARKNLGVQKEKARGELYDAINKTQDEGLVGRSQPEDDPELYPNGTRWKEWRIRKATEQERTQHWRGTSAEIRWVGERRTVKFSKDKGRTEGDWLFDDSGKTRADVIRGMEDNMPQDATLTDEGLKSWRDLENETGGYAFLNPANISKGPGAAASGEPGTYSAIKQLSDQMETAPAKTVQDGLRLRERMADKVAGFKDAATRILARARAIPATLKQLSSGVRTFNDVDRRVGELDYALQRSAGLSREAGDAIAKGIKNDAMRDATAIWIDAKGDEAAIRDTLANLPEGTTPRVRRALEAALNLPEDVKTKASEISQYFQVREEEAIAEGIFDQGLEDYYTHIWKRRENMPGSVLSALNSGRINEYFKFARQRKIPTFLEGIQQGKEPLLDPAKVVPYYNYLLDRAIASRKFVKSLEEVNAADGRPVLAAVGTRSVIKEGDVPKATLIKLRVAPEGASDYRSIDHPALRKWKWAAMDENGAPVFYEGDLRVHPDHFERLANMMDRSRLNPSNLARLALRASTEVKGFKLGVASFFHPIQVGTHALFHWTSPIVRGEIDWEAPATKFAIEKGGLQLAPDPRAIAEFSEGILTPGLIHQVPIIGPLSRALSEWTFADYIPKLKLQTFETVLARDKVRYKGKLSDEQIAQRAGDAVNNAFGELNRLWLGKYGRDPRFQRFLRGIFLAPDFGEARLRFVSKAATRFGGEERLALATAGIGLFLAARVGNMLSHGDPELEDWHHWFDVKTGNRWFGVRSIVGDISHLITKPRQFWEVRLNPLYSRTALAALSGRNPSGHKFAGVTDFAADIGKQFVPIHLGALTRDDQRLWESFLGAMGAQSWKASATAEIHRVARDWREKRGIKDNTEILAGADSPYRKARLALEFQDRQKFHEAIGELIKQRQAAGDRTPRKTIETNFRRYYHMPFAGNARLEGDFRRSLNERDRRLYQDAKKERDALWNQFQAWY